MQKSFFTNENENTLENKINHLLDNDKNIEFLDFLIGYFRITGFNKIANKVKSEIKMIRILIGINTDKNTYDASELIKKFSDEQIEQYNKSPILEKDYINFISMKKLIEDKKIKIRISQDKNVHSKLYILRSDVKINHTGDGNKYFGSGIIGSSNLTYNGLENNIEMNVEINTTDMNEAVKVFEELWEKAIDIKSEDIDNQIIKFIKKPKDLETKTITIDNITPYQLYIKTLQVYFDKRIDLINFDNDDMPKDFKSFNYQSDAVQDGISKLNKYNGFYLADVVGLGKTIVAILIIKRLKLQTLIIAPKSVLKQWLKAIKDFKIESIECISKDSIPSSTIAELIIIDEAHNFRNNDTNRYEKLEKICKHPYQKKIMLLSATPQNNEPIDIANQLYLFQNQNIEPTA